MRFIIILISVLFIAGCRPTEVPFSLQNEIDSIVIKYVPDQREEICTAKLKMEPGNVILISGETNIPGAKKEILNILTKSGFNFTDSLSVLPDPLVLKKTWGLITLSVSNMKKRPSHSSELVSQAIMGTPVKIFKKDGGWLLVQTPDYYLGWVDDSGIAELTDIEFDKWKKSERLIYTAKSGDIISETDGGVVSDIVAGSIVNLVSEKKEFFVVQLPDGRRGRILKRDAARFSKWLSEMNVQPERMILFGRSLTGSPYLWGGTSTKGVDCSGFVKTMYFTEGIILARDASQQFLHGEPVEISHDFSKLQKGDLLFFGHLVRGVKRITHVGLYIGDTEVIHSSGMVQVSSLDSTRNNFSRNLLESLMGARRLIGQNSVKGIEKIKLNSWYNYP
jgi:hypothetical protein